MANIPIWPGSSSFFPGDTPFGFYDDDFQFQTDTDKFAKFAAQRLGYPLVEIELQDINFYTAFEEAITTYGNELYAYQVSDNLLTFQGVTSSISSTISNVVCGFSAVMLKSSFNMLFTIKSIMLLQKSSTCI